VLKPAFSTSEFQIWNGQPEIFMGKRTST